MGLLMPGPYVTKYKIRGVIFIIGAILTFAATIRSLGLVIAAFATIIDLRGGGRGCDAGRKPCCGQ